MTYGDYYVLICIMSRKLELHKLCRRDEILALAPVLGADALQAWFDAQPVTPGASARTKLVGDETYTATIRHPRTLRVRNTHLTLSPIGTQLTAVTFYGRRTAVDTRVLLPDYEDFVWADHPLLRWQQRSGRFDMIAVDTWVGEAYEAPIIGVTAPSISTVVQAEDLLLGAARLLTSSEIPAAPVTE